MVNDPIVVEKARVLVELWDQVPVMAEAIRTAKSRLDGAKREKAPAAVIRAYEVLLEETVWQGGDLQRELEAKIAEFPVSR